MRYDVNMAGFLIEIVRFVDDSFPGWVECKLIDAYGREKTYVEKIPIVTAEDLDSLSHYPRPGVIACEVVERNQIEGREVVSVDTTSPWGVESVRCETQFAVLTSQLLDFEIG